MMGVAMWDDWWMGRRVLCRCHNAAEVAVVNSASERVMHLLRSGYDITLVIEHIKGVDNQHVDTLSHSDCLFFQVPGAQSMATLIPQDLVQALVLKRPDWTS